jgi:hypothetical protein
MVDKTYSVYGRKIPLKQILEEMTEEQIRMGIIRWNKDRIDIIGMTEVTIFSLKLMNLCFLIVHIHTFLVFQQEIEHEQVFCQGIWLYIPGLM